jgi:hypothetical protein
MSGDIGWVDAQTTSSYSEVVEAQTPLELSAATRTVLTLKLDRRTAIFHCALAEYQFGPTGPRFKNLRECQA